MIQKIKNFFGLIIFAINIIIVAIGLKKDNDDIERKNVRSNSNK